MRVLHAVILAAAAGILALASAGAREPEYRLVHDASALVGLPAASVAAAIRAEAPSGARTTWLAAFEQAAREAHAAVPPADRRPEADRWTAPQVARWLELNSRDLATPTSRVRAAVRGVCVVGPAPLHRRVHELIDAVTAIAWSCHRFELSVLAVAPAFLQRLQSQAFTRIGNGAIPGFRLKKAEAEAFLAALSAREGYLDRGQGVLSLAWGEGAALSLVRETTHAADLEQHFAFGRGFGVPRPGVAEDGLRLQASVDEPLGDSVRFHLKIRSALLLGLQPLRTSMGTLEVPTLTSMSYDLEERMQPGEAIAALGVIDPLAGENPRGRAPSGTAMQMLLLVRYVGKQSPTRSPRGEDLVRQLESEPGRRVEAPVEGAPTRTELFDVRDVIVVDATDFRSTLRGGGNGAPDSAGKEESPGRLAGLNAATERLAELVRENVLPTFWTSQPGAGLAPAADGALAVIAPEGVQVAVRRFLDDLRTCENTLVTTHVHLFGGRAKPDAPRVTHVLPALAQNREMTAQELTRLIERAFPDVELRVLQAPRLTTFQGQGASILVADQIAYLKDHQIQNGPTGVVLDPLVETMQTGMLLQLRAVSHPGGEWIRLEGTLEVAGVAEPMHPHPFGVPADAGRRETSISLEMPTSRRIVHTFTEVISRGHGMFLAVPGWIPLSDGGRQVEGQREELYLLVRSVRTDLAGLTSRPDGAGESEDVKKR